MAVTGWWPRRLPPRRDVGSAALCAAVGAVLYAVGLYDPKTPLALVLIPFAVIVCADLFRSTAPLLALAVGVAAVAADLLLGGSIGTWQVFFDLVYAACGYGPRGAVRWLIGASAVVTFAALVVTLLVLRADGSGWRLAVQAGVAVAMAVTLVTVLPATTGAAVRAHRDRLAEHREHARQLARLTELDHRASVAAERAAMARELHDVIAGHLTAIAVGSAAALRVAGDSAPALREALHRVRNDSVQGLTEMRAMIGLLREPDSDEPPTTRPGLGGVARLVNTAGVAVTLHDELTESDRAALPTTVDLAGYRIVQEALTNALKHAAPGPVEVRLGRVTDAVTVLVTSPLAAAGRDPAAPGSGHGLIGMRERAALLGGTLTAGPDGNRWAVRARLPLRVPEAAS
ncbi:two-component sensor histidine kinase [Actinocatenispora thailandica]|uniref:histidine kinase n=1 Tax=Actinocatenispora thailandica TaxID=227318 RepID=A0A7R7DMM5_9ACTN|nr:histidine kinase [Actinocatenispora thailandica]BCJ34470.1 two-component sensor histidine kinase [Actinocatenispora thailandica]